MRLGAMVAAGLGLLAAPPALAMDAQTFHDKAQALKAKGVGALWSTDYKLLKQEGEAAGTRVRMANDAARKSGRPLYCTPKAGGKLNSNELMTHLATIPEARRRTMSMDAVMRELLVAKYPCR